MKICLYSPLINYLSTEQISLKNLGIKFGTEENKSYFWESQTVTYSDLLGGRYTGLGNQTLMPQKHFPSFAFSVVL